MANVDLTINGKSVTVPAGTSILNAAKTIGIKIPTLCYTPDLPAWASCGMCVIKNVDPRTGRARMARACCTSVTPGMNIVTQDADLMKARRTVLELILSNHPNDCLKCSRSGNCELQTLAQEFGLRQVRFQEILKDQEPDASYPEIVLYRNKCINCGRCVEACQQMQNVFALEYNGRGDKTVIGPVGGVDLAHSPCVHCGQCAVHCPTGAIMSLNPINSVFDKLADKNLTSVVAIAPSVRAAIGEEFGFKPGTLTTGKIYAALRAIGFKYVFDTNFAADLTIMEEGSELIERIVDGGKKEPLPLFTSCCPGWVDYAEKKYKDLLPNLSTAKSPQQMQGSITKTYFAEKIGKKANEIYNVSVMPCTAKLYEAQRDENMKSSGTDDYDMVLTTRELAQLIKEAGIDFANLPEEKADSPIGAYTGAGTIFGATGGVMEAAVRSAYYLINKKELGPIEFKDIRGLDGVKTAEVTIKDGLTLKLCVVHQLGNVDKVMQQIRDAYKNKTEQPYTFVEVMACRGGCVGGGGQPYGVTDELRAQRAAALYQDDENSTIRQSHNNPDIATIYKEFLEKPLGEMSHKYLHTTYKAIEQYR